jgi:hypothetical protein
MMTIGAGFTLAFMMTIGTGFTLPVMLPCIASMVIVTLPSLAHTAPLTVWLWAQLQTWTPSNTPPPSLFQGIPTVERAVINVEKEVAGEGGVKRPEYNLLVEGTNLQVRVSWIRRIGGEAVVMYTLMHWPCPHHHPQPKKSCAASHARHVLLLPYNPTTPQAVMGIPGVDGLSTTTNHIMEVVGCLGIEAARATIVNEIKHTMGSHGMSVDARHIMLLADCM